jgi:hypothetical protein
VANPLERRPNPRQFLPDVPYSQDPLLQQFLFAVKEQVEKLALDVDLPARPTTFTVSDYRSGAALLKWVPTPKAVGYRIWRHTSNSFDDATLVAELTGFGNVRYVDITPSATSYYYWLQGVNAVHEPGPRTDSVVVTVTT